MPPAIFSDFGMGTAPVAVAITPDGTKAVVRAGASPLGDAIIFYDLATATETIDFPAGTTSPAAELVEARATLEGGRG